MTSTPHHTAAPIERPEHRLTRWARTLLSRPAPAVVDQPVNPRAAKRTPSIDEALVLLDAWIDQHRAVTGLLLAEVAHRRRTAA